MWIFLFESVSTPLAAHPLKQEARKGWSTEKDSSSGRPIRPHISADDLWPLAMKMAPPLKGAQPPIAVESCPLGTYQEFETGFCWLQPFEGNVECQASKISEYVPLAVHC